MTSVLAVMVGIILTLLILQLASGETTTHGDMSMRIGRVEEQLAYQSCILLIHPEDRIPDRVAECQVLAPLESQP